MDKTAFSNAINNLQCWRKKIFTLLQKEQHMCNNKRQDTAECNK